MEGECRTPPPFKGGTECVRADEENRHMIGGYSVVVARKRSLSCDVDGGRKGGNWKSIK